MRLTSRVLLVEQLDAFGSAPADARLHAAALRAAGLAVEGLVLGGDRQDDLLFPMHERRVGTGYDVLDASPEGLASLARRVRASRFDLLLWAGALRGGGAAARALPGGIPACWWATGHAPAEAEVGPLPALDAALAPVAGSAVAHDDERRTLSLWDGPFVLVLAPPSAAGAAGIVDAFAVAAEDRDEVDLVVLDHPHAALEASARRAGVAQRVHFVGPAPREAEHAWLASAALALLPGDAAVSGGLILRALASGCPLLPVGPQGASLAAWLAGQGLAWAAGERAALPGEAMHAALERAGAVLAVRERGRAVAAAHGVGALGLRLAEALREHDAPARRAA